MQHRHYAEFATRHRDETSISETYPLHVACANGHCPNDVIRLLIEQYPPACEHLSNINEGIYDDNEVAGLPLHYYLAQNKNVDIDTIKLLVEAYPQSLMTTDEDICYPIHALFLNNNNNKRTDSLHTIIKYMHECSPASLRVLDAAGGTPLHVACQSKNVNLAIVELIFNAWPESIRMRDHSDWLPIHDLCHYGNVDDADALAILQFMLDADPNLPKVRTDEGGYLPIHLAADEMSIEFCKVLIDVYPESLRVGTDHGSLPIHEACKGGRVDAVDTVQFMLNLFPESINTGDNDRELPIHIAATYGKSKVIELLLKHDPDAATKKIENNRGLPLHIACCAGNIGATKVLYDAYPQALNARDGNRETPIELAEKSSLKRFLQAQVLYARKAQDMKTMTTLDHNGWLPLHHALKDKAPLGSIRLLLEGNPSAIRTADIKLVFPLHIACKFSLVKVVRYLVGESNEHIVSHLDANKDSVLHYACRGGNLDVIKYLMENHSSVVASVEMNLKKELPLHLLCEAGKRREDSDDSTLYIETIWLMLLADPEALMS